MRKTKNDDNNVDRIDQLGSVVRKIRLEHGLTQSQVAEALHVTPGYISNVENGRTAMSLRVLVYYAELTQTTLDSLVGLTHKEYQVTAMDNDIMDIVSGIKPEEKKKLLQVMTIWFKK